MQITQGQRVPLSSLIQGSDLTLSIAIKSAQVIDYVCFGVDANGKLSDDRYMVFFNQPSSPCNSVKQVNGGSFQLSLAGLPALIERLVFTASIDGAGTMSEIQASHFSIQSQGREVARGEFSGATFTAEKAIMVADIYRKNGEWRIASNLQGYNAGLDALVVHFGGEVADAPAPAPAAPPRISLEKKIADAAPQLISLAKKAQVSLEKARLTDTKARVGLVLDASGSMNPQYTRGHVQEVVDRLIPLAVHFDDDGALDCWAFGAKPQQLNAVTLSNFQNFIRTDHGGWKDWELGARINDEPKAMRMVIDYYKKSGDKTPIYILFISDGGVHQDREITRLMTEAAKLPIFWQFVGLGGRGYGILEKLDDMGGRVVDNCNFFALDRLDEIPEEKLYDLLMEEFPDWLKAAKGAGIL
ncbi:VWA domain-containing protein [Pseudomonas savastanoi pv. phaseolicola]|uniref:Tellurium resistance protein, putative n=5 Tax=Pseudomonas savastanoi TaxID=29438 RepID=Q48NA1_PSE14|nr:MULTISPECIES: VWA domain-containing protein [Pseudomonas]KPB86585.1 Tellurium resistance protein [Pseudomonas syringae pv. maculicola]AAZ36085.1 tellurium resistance protein, putative [Pseudomonas savastanoi pv. phaseolicola 1448A]KPB36812.1 Tellurium resistance protein [Pseudomonas savastanoi pv. phaseolicola]KPB38174.1 Tellurium resistance protein [Pseudomonas savastanoi pv. phaseolicola]KPB44487.1 Tellurium resistance protein [Pseudomonas savastanoi pv. phaseolicola]